jgi:hypothetical protein
MPPSDVAPSSFISSVFSSPYQGAPTGRLDSSFKRRARRPRSHPNSEGHRRQANEPSASSPDTSPTTPRERLDAKFRPPFHLATATRSNSSGAVEVEDLRVQQVSENWLPSALVLTGLEHCSVPCHRALLRTLLENRVTFGEDSDGAEPSFRELPPDFILVYVCPFDPRERPPIHKSLVSCQLSPLLTGFVNRTRSSTSFR